MSEQLDRIPNRAWWLCILLFGATTLNYLDRQTVSILAPAIQREMGLDNAALGWLFSVFYYTYTFSQFAIGAVLDRVNLRWAFVIAVLAWSVAAGLTTLAGGFSSLLLCRLLLGIAESANWPAAMRIVARALPPRDRSLGNGIFTSGTSIGALIAPSLILGIAGAVGWRWSFLAVASLAVLWLGAWVRFTRNPEFAPVWKTAEAASVSAASAYSAVLRSRAFWKVFAVTILVNPCLYFNLNWLPTYFAQQRGLQLGREVGFALTLIYLGLDLGYLACGFGVRVLAQRILVSRARRVVFLTATLLMASMAAVPFIRGTTQAIAVLVVVNFAVGVWIAMYLTMAQEVSVAHVSTAAGLLGGAGSLAGALAMWMVGKVTQQTGSFVAPMAGVAGAGILAAFAGLAITGSEPATQPGVLTSRPERPAPPERLSSGL
jgi:ACS family hexuronate transporter-like MFS transporter